MKKFSLLFLSLFITQLAISQSMKDFEWITGEWNRENVNPGTSALELWKKTKNGYEGKGVSMNGSDTTFVEFLSIVEKEGEFYYVANVSSNTKPTYFKIVSISKNEFISENPQHDFPKKITYSLKGNKLTAIISAGEKKMGFVFVRKE